jgi:hypothetical protein
MVELAEIGITVAGGAVFHGAGVPLRTSMGAGWRNAVPWRLAGQAPCRACDRAGASMPAGSAIGLAPTWRQLGCRPR